MLDGATPKEIVTEYPEYLVDYYRLRQSYLALKLDTDRPEDTDGVKGIWLHGPKGSGKSRWAQEQSMLIYGQPPFKLTDNSWFDQYDGQKVILVEDLDYITAHNHAHNLKHWADRYASKGQIKGSMTWLRHDVLIVTSQSTIEELYGPDDEKHTKKQRKARMNLYEAIQDRFQEIEFKPIPGARRTLNPKATQMTSNLPPNAKKREGVLGNLGKREREVNPEEEPRRPLPTQTNPNKRPKIQYPDDYIHKDETRPLIEPSPLVEAANQEITTEAQMQRDRDYIQAQQLLHDTPPKPTPQEAADFVVHAFD